MSGSTDDSRHGLFAEMRGEIHGVGPTQLLRVAMEGMKIEDEVFEAVMHASLQLTSLKMSILNQSITPSRQPLQPNSKGFNIQVAVGEISHVSMNGISNISQALLQHSLMTKGKKLDLMEESSLGALDLSSRPSYALAVSVTSATQLDSKQIDLISRKMQRLTGFRYLRVENIIDPSVIAGFVISYGSEDSHVIDLSVKGQLASLAARVESSDQRITSHGQNWCFPSTKRS